MNYTFQSHFAVRLEKFIVQKNALGYPYQESSRILRKFDLFCLEHYPQETELTKEKRMQKYLPKSYLPDPGICAISELYW